MEKYRIENIQKIHMNGRLVKRFKAFKYSSDQKAYVFWGYFEAPENTPSHKLENYIEN